MKRYSIICILMLIFIHASAGIVNIEEAQATAKKFVDSRLIRINTSKKPANVRLSYTEKNSTDLRLPVYYVFNHDNGFVIVAGDDRAQEILAFGDNTLDMNNIPDNMRCWLTQYKQQIEFLHAHPSLIISRDKNLQNESKTIDDVAPLLTTMWGQSEPYWNHCVFNDLQCLTGCPATSLSMVMNYWTYPVGATLPVEGYTSVASGFPVVDVPDLPSITFDWGNMRDVYNEGNYTNEEADAVAWLMRYVGQVEEMNYSPAASGAMGEDILRAALFFGYGDAQLVTKSTLSQQIFYSDEEWAEMLQKELALERPVVYCAYADDGIGRLSGHAFNVDGYDSESNTYHINWGWNGRENGYFALNAFTGQSLMFNIAPQMIIGMENPVNAPIVVGPSILSIKCFTDTTSVTTFKIFGKHLTDDVTLTLYDPSGVFTLDCNSITAEDAMHGKMVSLVYNPTNYGYNEGQIILSSNGAKNDTINISALAELEVYHPILLPTDSNHVNLTSFRADWSDQTAAKNIASYILYVSLEPSFMLLESADFTDYPVVQGNLASVAEEYLPENWSFSGGGFWLDGGCIELAPNSSVTTGTFDLSKYNEVTVAVRAKNWSPYTNATLTIATSQESVSFKMSENYEEYQTVLNCEELDSISFIGGYYPMIQSIEIYAGSITEANLLMASEEGDAYSRLIRGITSRSYTINDLVAGGTFYYKVKALYIDGSESLWSPALCITLFDPEGVSATGDVNDDGEVNISDVTALIDYLLSGNASSVNVTNADCDGDGQVNISDVTALIDYLLDSH